MNEGIHRSLACIFSPLLVAALIGGCAGHALITGKAPVATASGEDGTNSVILYEEHYSYSPGGTLLVRTHTLVSVGSHGTEEWLTVYDGSVTKLTGYEARVIHAGGAVEWYDRGDLNNHSLSNGRAIAEHSIKFVQVKEVPRPGDLIETVSEHEMTLPQLGISFSAGHAGADVDTARCVISVPAGDSLMWRTLNGMPLPVIVPRQGVVDYVFSTLHYPSHLKRSAYAKTNDSPALVANIVAPGSQSWEAFGDWYIGLIDSRLQPDGQIAETARRITRPEMSDIEKMNAIALWCQTAVRYEQVFLAKGEFIPEAAPVVFAKKYGDCKGYSCLILSMARALGIDAHPALCYRGAGYAFCGAVPVTQFNHMIVNLRSGGKDYWYDGTNRGGVPGVTSDDLINDTALVVARGASRLAVIAESEENLFGVGGTLHPRGSALEGSLRVTLSGQYGVGFNYIMGYWNQGEMQTNLAAWLKGVLSEHITLTGMQWKSRAGTFTLDIGCEIPDALVTVDTATYIRFDRIFDRLLPAEEPGRYAGETFRYPGYARVSADVTIPELTTAGGAGPFTWTARWALPPGPFDPDSSAAFVRRLGGVRAELGKTYHMVKGPAR